MNQSVREAAAIARNGDGDLAIFISPLAGAPQLDHFEYSAAEREIILYSRGIALGMYSIERGVSSEVLEQGYDRDLLVVQQFDDGRLAVPEQQVSPLKTAGPRS
ncbi:hypothetical protein ACVIGB_001141 [Bradyrhizobium sp. USDA 4341]